MAINNRTMLTTAGAVRGAATRRQEYAALLGAILCAEAIGLLLAMAWTMVLRPATNPNSLLTVTVLAATVWAALGVRAGLYRQMVVRVSLLDVPYVFSSMLQGAALVLVLLVTRDVNNDRLPVLGTLTVVAIPCRIMARSASQTVVRLFGSHSQSRMLIVGAGTIAQRMAATLIKYRDLGITVVGFVDDHEYDKGNRRVLGLPLWRGEDLARQIDAHNVDHVVFAFSRLPDSERIGLLRVCQTLSHLQVSLVPRMFEVTPANTRLLDVRGIPLLQFETSGLLLVLACKRVFDIVAVSLGLLVALPVMTAAALAIRLEGPGSILYRQTRVGLDGKPFTIYKLRSMRALRPGEDPASPARHTRVGRLLRASSIDELPQLWNVLRGDMSIVGPRPEQEAYAALFAQRIPRYAERHRMRGGITGLSQVSRLRGDTSIIERTQLDNFYIDNWSLWLDVKIILATFTALIPHSQGIGGDVMFQDVIAEVERQVTPTTPTTPTTPDIAPATMTAATEARGSEPTTLILSPTPSGGATESEGQRVGRAMAAEERSA